MNIDICSFINLLKNYSCNCCSVYENMCLTSILFISLFVLYKCFVNILYILFTMLKSYGSLKSAVHGNTRIK